MRKERYRAAESSGQTRQGCRAVAGTQRVVLAQGKQKPRAAADVLSGDSVFFPVQLSAHAWRIHRVYEIQL